MVKNMLKPVCFIYVIKKKDQMIYSYQDTHIDFCKVVGQQFSAEVEQK